MNKQEFLAQLRKGLPGLPHDDREERLTFYSEMIEDRMEEGLSEEAAVCAIGNIDELILQITADISHAKHLNEGMMPKKSRKVWEIVLLVLGAPIWLSLLIAAFAVILSLYLSLWAVIISLWAVFASFIVSALGGIAAGIGLAIGGNGLTGTAMLGAGIACTGLSVFTFFGCKASTMGTVRLTKKIAAGMKNCLIKKEGA